MLSVSALYRFDELGFNSRVRRVIHGIYMCDIRVVMVREKI